MVGCLVGVVRLLLESSCWMVDAEWGSACRGGVEGPGIYISCAEGTVVVLGSGTCPGSWILVVAHRVGAGLGQLVGIY